MNYTHLSQFLFTEEEFNNKSKCSQCKIKCLNCGEIFIKTKDQLLDKFNSIDENSKYKDLYLKRIQCCTKCKDIYSPTHIIVDCECGYCHKKFQRSLNRVKDTKTNLQFCSQKCSRQYYADNNISRSTADLSWVDENPSRTMMFTAKEAQQANTPKTYYQKLLPCKCKTCGGIFKISVGELLDYHSKPTAKLQYCSQICHGEDKSYIEVRKTNCIRCGKEIQRNYNIKLNSFLDTRNKPIDRCFCDLQCADKWYIENGLSYKIIPDKRSKFEIYAENVLNALFPQLKIEYNNRTILNPYEIDIWIDSLKLGFEINGGMHYKPSLGSSKETKEKTYRQCIERDYNKMTKAKDMPLEIYSLDCSRIAPFYYYRSKFYLKFVIETICKYLNMVPDWKLYDNIEALIEHKLLDEFNKNMNDKNKIKIIKTSFLDYTEEDKKPKFEDIKTRLEFLTENVKK